MEQQIQGLKSPLPLAIIIAGTLVAIALIYNNSSNRPIQKSSTGVKKVVQDSRVSAIEETVIPLKGVTLPVSWGVMGQNLTKAGVIRGTDFKALYADRNAFADEDQRLLLGTTTKKSSYYQGQFWHPT